MTSRELIFAALRNEKTERTPWLPFVGSHAASLIGVDVEAFSHSADLIERGMIHAYELYRPDALPAMFDLQLEAEAMGCALKFASDNPPAVITHPMEEGKTLADLKVPCQGDGRIPIAMEVTRRLKARLGGQIALYGLVTGPFTLGLHLRGTDIFYDMIDEPDETHALMAFCREVCVGMSRMYIEAGADVIAVVDPMTSQISPKSFSEFVSPYASAVFDEIRAAGRFSSFFVCGAAKNNIEEMCKCRPDNISIDENIPLEYVRDVCRRYGVSLGGNIKLTLTMLFGTPADNINDAQNCIAIAGNQGFILAPGCDMPYAVPPENVRAITSLVRGEVADFMERSNVLEGIDVVMPDYLDPAHVYIDVVTLDSASCAPCQYMMEAVTAACAGLGDAVSVAERSIKRKEGVVAMLRLGATNIPTICIDGVIEYVSIIPAVEVLRGRIAEALRRKGIAADGRAG